mgnify:CR=1 FL=1
MVLVGGWQLDFVRLLVFIVEPHGRMEAGRGVVFFGVRGLLPSRRTGQFRRWEPGKVTWGSGRQVVLGEVFVGLHKGVVFLS